MQVRRYLPNALTMGNLLSGVLVIIGLFIWPYGTQLNEFQGAQISEIGALSQRLHGQGMLALALIWIAGQLCDLLDGIAARWAKTEGPMGIQLDSMADLVSSGIAPAVAGIAFLHTWAPALPTAAKFLPLTMAMAAAWRLARFNVEVHASNCSTRLFRHAGSGGSSLVDWRLAHWSAIRDVWIVWLVRDGRCGGRGGEHCFGQHHHSFAHDQSRPHDGFKRLEEASRL